VRNERLDEATYDDDDRGLVRKEEREGERVEGYSVGCFRALGLSFFLSSAL
jgi:hypothetical protein